MYRICAIRVSTIAILPLMSSLFVCSSLASCFKFVGRMPPPPEEDRRDATEPPDNCHQVLDVGRQDDFLLAGLKLLSLPDSRMWRFIFLLLVAHLVLLGPSPGAIIRRNCLGCPSWCTQTSRSEER